MERTVPVRRIFGFAVRVPLGASPVVPQDPVMSTSAFFKVSIDQEAIILPFWRKRGRTARKLNPAHTRSSLFYFAKLEVDRLASESQVVFVLRWI